MYTSIQYNSFLITGNLLNETSRSYVFLQEELQPYIHVILIGDRTPSPDRAIPNREICFGAVRFGPRESWSHLPCCPVTVLSCGPPTVNRANSIIGGSRGSVLRLQIFLE